MAEIKAAVKLQEQLLEKGFKSIEFCDDIEDGLVTISHHYLTKDEGPSKDTKPCLNHKWYDLASVEAVQILEKWMAQTEIFPDPRVL
jgi:hypothetical protein